MKLLVITQKVDRDDPVLGFFHRWLEEFAKRFQRLTVICLEKGEYSLPSNVKVLSLGKEHGHSKVRYVALFYQYIWQERGNYDAVFVHMNQEYVLLAGDLWRLWGKKIYLWRNHREGGHLTRLAMSLAHKVFHTSPQAFVASSPKAALMPAGIDLGHFKPASVPVEENRILVFGRLSPVKKISEVIAGLKELGERRVDYSADIVGEALAKDRDYADELKEEIRRAGLSTRVRLLPAVPHTEAPELYRQYKLLVNLTADGSLDKTIFEALASGLKVVVANSFFKSRLPSPWVVENPGDTQELSEKLASVLQDSHGHNSETQGKISVLLKEHGLDNLMNRIKEEIS